MIDYIPDLTKMIGDTPISDSTPHNVADLGMRCRWLERQLNAANERIKRLEEAGRLALGFAAKGDFHSADEVWNEAKEAKL